MKEKPYDPPDFKRSNIVDNLYAGGMIDPAGGLSYTAVFAWDDGEHIFFAPLSSPLVDGRWIRYFPNMRDWYKKLHCAMRVQEGTRKMILVSYQIENQALEYDGISEVRRDFSISKKLQRGDLPELLPDWIRANEQPPAPALEYLREVENEGRKIILKRLGFSS